MRETPVCFPIFSADEDNHQLNYRIIRSLNFPASI